MNERQKSQAAWTVLLALLGLLFLPEFRPPRDSSTDPSPTEDPAPDDQGNRQQNDQGTDSTDPSTDPTTDGSSSPWAKETEDTTGTPSPTEDDTTSEGGTGVWGDAPEDSITRTRSDPTGDAGGDGNTDPSLRTGEDGNTVYDPTGNGESTSVGVPDAPNPGGEEEPGMLPTSVDLGQPLDDLSAALNDAGWAAEQAGAAALDYAVAHPTQTVVIASTAVGVGGWLVGARVGWVVVEEAAAQRLLAGGAVSAGSMSEARAKIREVAGVDTSSDSNTDQQVTTNPDPQPDEFQNIDPPDTLGDPEDSNPLTDNTESDSTTDSGSDGGSSVDYEPTDSGYITDPVGGGSTGSYGSQDEVWGSL